MSLWSWFTEKEEEYIANGDQDRMEMADCFKRAFDLIEREPDHACGLLREGQRRGEQLNEPWWAYLYEVWQVLTVVGSKRDLRNILDEALRCYLKGQRADLEGHPWFLAILNKLICIYASIDSEGYADEIRAALAHAEEITPFTSMEHRSVLLSDKATFYRLIGCLDTAWEIALEHLEYLESATEASQWYEANVRASLCNIAFYARDWTNLRLYSGEFADLVQGRTNRQSDLAEARLWQAILARCDKEELEAKRLYLQAKTLTEDIGKIPAEEYFDSLAYFHELGEDYQAALQTRELAWLKLSNLGMFGTETRLHIDRCRLLALLGKLTPADLKFAREVACKLRKPEKSLAAIEIIASGGARPET